MTLVHPRYRFRFRTSKGSEHLFDCSRIGSKIHEYVLHNGIECQSFGLLVNRKVALGRRDNVYFFTHDGNGEDIPDIPKILAIVELSAMASFPKGVPFVNAYQMTNVLRGCRRRRASYRPFEKTSLVSINIP